MRILVVQPEDDSPLGSLTAPLLAAGAELERWHTAREASPGRPTADYDGIIVLGGIAHPDEDGTHPWLATARGTLVEALERGQPTLGICLGGQLLAQAAGGAATAAEQREVGWFRLERTPEAHDDPLFRHFPDAFETFEWHYYRFELPPGAVLLARNDAAPQAFRVGESAWGTQFHIEASADTICEWLSIAPDQVRANGADPAMLRRETKARDPRHAALARELAARFATVVARYAGDRNRASPLRTS